MPPKFTFKGLMAPVFTPYLENNDRDLNVNAIEPYARLLKAKNVHGVLVNGTTGEGTLLSMEERKRVTVAWREACRAHAMTMMVQVGGAPFADVRRLAEHAEQTGVDAVMCLPELYFKPKTAEQLVQYLKNVAAYCPKTPFFYYHIPMFTDVTVHMPSFLELAEREIPNFCGLKYTSGDLDQGSACLKDGRTIFLGADTILCGAVASGFECFIMTTLNICPEVALNIIADVRRGNVDGARRAQNELNRTIAEICKHGDWVTAMKKAFNERESEHPLGKTRPPLTY